MAAAPKYVDLHRSGEIERRVRASLEGLRSCRACPWECGTDRVRDAEGICRTGRRARVNSFFPHHGEERCLRGTGGSGTIFFARCNLQCVFCQNYDISQRDAGFEASALDLAGMMLDLQLAGCHNINLVTPEHVVPQALEGLQIAIDDGLRLPVVYNTSGFDSLDSLRFLDGIVDIYMPDFKLWTEANAARFLKCGRYPEAARAALREMHRQVGDLTIDERGIARHGLLVRHLVMPGLVEETREILRFLAGEISPDTYVNIMDQYHPAGVVGRGDYAEIDRAAERGEVEAAFRHAREAGLHRFEP